MDQLWLILVNQSWTIKTTREVTAVVQFDFRQPEAASSRIDDRLTKESAYW